MSSLQLNAFHRFSKTFNFCRPFSSKCFTVKQIQQLKGNPFTLTKLSRHASSLESSRLVQDSPTNLVIFSADSLTKVNEEDEHSSAFVSVQWKDLGNLESAGNICEYPAVWLRDNCQCPRCYSKHANARLLLMKDLDVDVKPGNIKVVDNQVDVEWSDGHISSYDSSWLQERSFSASHFTGRKLMADGPEKEIWGSEHQNNIKYHNFENIIVQEHALYSWLHDLSVLGLCIVTNLPASLDSLPALTQKIGFEKNTHYGTYFRVKSRAEQISNLAYTSAALGLHLDLPYYDFVPGVQFLHCLEQYELEGGDNQFSDGFMIEDVMRKQFPEDWKILTEMGVPFLDDGTETLDGSGEFNKVKIVPTFDLDKHGVVKRVNYNNQVRDQFPVMSSDHTYKLYKALKRFNDIAYDDSVMIKYKLKPGECVVFDNHRVLHGRVGYTLDPKGGTRFYNGCYVDWDEVLSTLNLLRVKLKIPA